MSSMLELNFYGGITRDMLRMRSCKCRQHAGELHGDSNTTSSMVIEDVDFPKM